MITKISALYEEVAEAHHIDRAEAVDEVHDAIEILWAPENRPEATVVDYERVAILEYIKDQYCTNRTRL